MINLLVTLAPLALEAYDRYVDHVKSKNIDESDGLSQREIEDLLEVRMEIAKVCVSLWSHCCYLDGELQEEEDELTNEMIVSLLDEDSLFPEDIANQDAVLEELVETFEEPLSMKSIINYAKEDEEFSMALYEQACLIVASDASLDEEEEEFLNDLALEFEISNLDKKRLYKKYLKNL